MTAEQQTRHAGGVRMSGQLESRDSDDFVYQRLSDEQLKGYRDNGFLRLGPVLTDDGLETMREQCMSAWRVEKGEFDPDKTSLQTRS